MTAKGHKQTFTTVLKKVRFLGKSGHYSPFGKESANSHKRTCERRRQRQIMDLRLFVFPHIAITSNMNDVKIVVNR